MAKARSPTFCPITLIAASLCSLFLGQSAATAQQKGKIVGWGSQVVGVDLDGGFIAVAAGEYHSLGLKADGSIAAWGQDWYGQCDIPSPNGDFIAVAAGEYHSLGLKAEGSIAAWGRNGSGECDIPSPNADFVAVAVGGRHSLGLKKDGSIVARGSNEDDWGYWLGQASPPDGNDFVAIAAGGNRSLALKADGSITAWGSDGCVMPGQCKSLLPMPISSPSPQDRATLWASKLMASSPPGGKTGMASAISLRRMPTLSPLPPEGPTAWPSKGTVPSSPGAQTMECCWDTGLVKRRRLTAMILSPSPQEGITV